MKIVVLDSFPLCTGDLDWSNLEKLGVLVKYDNTHKDDVIRNIGDAEIVLTNKVVLNREIIEQLGSVKYIGVLAAGYNVVDTLAAREKNIVVTNTPNYGSKGVAQMAMALLLEITNGVGLHAASVNGGKWGKSTVFCYWEKPQIDLDGLTLGVVGYGNIAKEFIKLAEAFGMNVIVHTRTKRDDVNWVTLEELYMKADVISLHCPLSAENKEMINENSIKSMKDGVIIINTARGGLVNEKDLQLAVKSGKVYGVGSDVLSSEPPLDSNPLLNVDNIYVTPHIAWAPKKSRINILNIATENISEFLKGREKNRVN